MPAKPPWFARSAQILADEHQTPTYIVTRQEPDDVVDDVILFASELEEADLPNILFGFEPRTV